MLIWMLYLLPIMCYHSVFAPGGFRACVIEARESLWIEVLCDLQLDFSMEGSNGENG